MRWILLIVMGSLGISCSDKKLRQPGETNLEVRMLTDGAERFEEYIHSLNIYAFRKQSDDSYVYFQTIAQLNEKEIAGLEDGSANGNSKYFKMNLPIGIYEIYMLGNVSRDLASDWVEEVTTPADCRIEGNAHGEDSVCFLGNIQVKIIASPSSPLKVTLNRIVSKLVLVLYEVPIQIDSVRLVLGNLATDFSLDGTPGGMGKEIVRNYSVRKTTSTVKDTLVGEIVTFPSLTGGSPLQLTFYAANGQEKVKDMPIQTLLPNKYLRVVGVVSDTPGGLLNFELNVKVYLSDYFLERPLPDFVLNPPKK